MIKGRDEQPNGRDVRGELRGKGMRLPEPVQGGPLPPSARVPQPGSSPNPILLGFSEASSQGMTGH